MFHVNAQSLIKKRLTLEDITKDLGTNTIYGISETWLKETDDLKLWKNNQNNFKTFGVLTEIRRLKNMVEEYC